MVREARERNGGEGRCKIVASMMPAGMRVSAEWAEALGRKETVSSTQSCRKLKAAAATSHHGAFEAKL